MFFDLGTAGPHVTGHSILSITAMLPETDDLNTARAAVLAGGKAWMDGLDQEGQQLEPPAAFADHPDHDGPVSTTFVQSQIPGSRSTFTRTVTLPTAWRSGQRPVPPGCVDTDARMDGSSRRHPPRRAGLVAHNGNKFDLPFLAHRLRRCKLALPGNVTHLVDTMQVACHAGLDKAEHDHIKQDGEEAGDIGHHGRRNLGAMCRDVVHGAGFGQHLGVPAHTSLGDVLAMLAVPRLGT